MIALTCLNVIVNVTLMIIASVRMLKMGFLKLRWKYRHWKYQQKLKQDDKLRAE